MARNDKDKNDQNDDPLEKNSGRQPISCARTWMQPNTNILYWV